MRPDNVTIILVCEIRIDLLVPWRELWIIIVIFKKLSIRWYQLIICRKINTPNPIPTLTPKQHCTARANYVQMTCIIYKDWPINDKSLTQQMYGHDHAKSFP